MILVERQAEMSALLDAAAAARDGAGRLVLVAGEAGVGKSALVEALESRLADARWLAAACDGQFTPRPLGPLLDVADQVGGPLAELCRADAGRGELFAALLDTLRGTGLTVLVIEDLHWADEATLDLVRFLARRVRAMPCLVVATYRDDALTAEEPLRVALGDLGSQRGTQHIDVRPLSLGAVSELAGRSGLDAQTLHGLTGGNAFFLSELLAAGSTDLPRSARDAVLARAARVSPQARAALEVAAFVGGRMDPVLLAKAGLDGVDVDELVEAGLLVADGRAVRFRHELARVAIDAGVTPHRRVELHRRVLDALQSFGCDDDARLAFHADGGRRRRRRSSATRRARRDALLRSAPTARPSPSTGAPCSTPTRPTSGRSRCCSTTSRRSSRTSTAGRRLPRPGWRRWPSGVGSASRCGSATALRRLASVMWRLCRGEESVRCSAEAIEVLAPLGPSVELGWAYALQVAPTRRTSRRWSPPSTGPASWRRQLEQPDLLGYVLICEAEVAYRVGGDWERPLRDALRMAADHHLDQLAGSAYSSLYEFYVTTFQVAAGETDYEAGVAMCDDREMAVVRVVPAGAAGAGPRRAGPLGRRGGRRRRGAHQHVVAGQPADVADRDGAGADAPGRRRRRRGARSRHRGGDVVG